MPRRESDVALIDKSPKTLGDPGIDVRRTRLKQKMQDTDESDKGTRGRQTGLDKKPKKKGLRVWRRTAYTYLTFIYDMRNRGPDV